MSDANNRLNAVIAELGVEAKKSLGQNFLISDHVIGKIIAAAAAMKANCLIEIGPGPGALTDLLLKFSLPIRLIELDRNFAEHWRSKNLEVIERDALQIDWKELIGEETVLVSNLPYQISSSLVIDRSLDAKMLKGMVLMFQKEVAQRIRAQSSTENYGLLTVIAQAFWKVETVVDASSGDFKPPPRVASRVLGFTPLNSTIQDKKLFLRFVKAAFSQRRKLMKSNLKSFFNEKQLTVENLEQWLLEQKLSVQVRAEELSVEQFIQLFHHLGMK